MILYLSSFSKHKLKKFEIFHRNSQKHAIASQAGPQGNLYQDTNILSVLDLIRQKVLTNRWRHAIRERYNVFIEG